MGTLSILTPPLVPNPKPLTTASPRSVSGFNYFGGFTLSIFPTGLLILGVNDTALVAKVSAGINILLLSFMILSGFTKGDLHNWQLTEQDYKLATSGSSDSYRLGRTSCPKSC